MDEYISRKALLVEIAADHGNWIAYNDTDESYRQGVKDNYSDTIRLINDIPAADVQPVKHGKCITREQFAEAAKQLMNEFTANDGYGTSASTTFLALCFGNLELRLFEMDGDSE